MHDVTRSMQLSMAVLILASSLLFAATPASSQVPGPFSIDHYWVYRTFGPSANVPVTLEDQFGSSQNNVGRLTFFAIPVDKNNEGILDPFSHHTWWAISGEVTPPDRQVVVRNQFGEEVITVRRPS